MSILKYKIILVTPKTIFTYFKDIEFKMSLLKADRRAKESIEVKTLALDV